MDVNKCFYLLFSISAFSLAIFLLAWPFLKEGVPSGHDISAHLTYGKLFIHELDTGQFPVRWTEGVRPNTTQPLFNFYQVGFYYLLALTHKIFFSFIFSFKFSIIFLWFLGTFFTFLFTKKFGILPATLGAIIYAFSPYLILDIYIRASYPEFMALSLFPGLLYFLEQLLVKPKIIYISLFAGLLGTIIFSHLPAFIIILPVLSVYALFLILLGTASKKGVFYTLVAVILGLGISSFYLLPAVLELDFIQINFLRSDDFNFHKNFLSLDFLEMFR